MAADLGGREPGPLGRLPGDDVLGLRVGAEDRGFKLGWLLLGPKAWLVAELRGLSDGLEVVLLHQVHTLTYLTSLTHLTYTPYLPAYPTCLNYLPCLPYLPYLITYRTYLPYLPT